MTSTKKKLNAADLARQLHAEHPQWSPATICAAVVGQTGKPFRLAQVRRALESSGQRGRPKRGEGGERVTIWIDAGVVARAREQAAARGLTLSRYVESRLSAVEPGE